MLELAKKSLVPIFLAGVFLGVLSFFLLVATQKNSRAATDLLVVQNSENISDYYTMSKSVDYLNGVLIESVYSEKFLAEMKNIDNSAVDFLPVDKADRLKAWQKTVSIKKNANIGIITVEVFGDSSKQTVKISNALIDVLTNKYSLFLGQGQNIEIKVLSGPIAEKNPTIAQIFWVSIGGFIIGVLISCLWIYYREENENNNAHLLFGKNSAVINRHHDFE